MMDWVKVQKYSQPSVTGNLETDPPLLFTGFIPTSRIGHLRAIQSNHDGKLIALILRLDGDGTEWRVSGDLLPAATAALGIGEALGLSRGGKVIL